MKKIYFTLIFVIFISCDKVKSYKNEVASLALESPDNVDSNELNFEIDDDKTFNDLLSQKEYEKLYLDKDYNEYIKDFWETNISVNKKFFEQNEIQASLGILDKKIKKNTDNEALEQGEELMDLAKIAGKMVSTVVSVGKDTYGLIKLEKTKKELENSFSKQKKEIAKDFEVQLNSIINFSCNFPKNQKVKKNDFYQNYKSLGSSLSNDDDIMDYLKPLIKKTDKFFLNSVNVKSKIKINNVLSNNSDNSKLTDYGIKILNSKGNFEIETKSNLLSDYYTDLNEIVAILNNQKFSTPVEDWSEEKKENFNFIIEDIKIKLENEINSLNEQLKV
jgi:hypothetical protein